jgi:hypothetical protein
MADLLLPETDPSLAAKHAFGGATVEKDTPALHRPPWY